MSSDINTRVNSARKSFKSSITKPREFRRHQLSQFLKFIKKNEEALISAMEKDMRKHREEARLEIIIGINHLQYLLNNLSDWVKPEALPRRMVDLLDGVYVYNDPYGVVLVMGAWNVPLLTLLPVAGAIAAGNCVVIKPSHNSPHFSELVYKILPQYLDPDCYPVILGGIEETQLLLKEKFDYIYYTGSVSVGKLVHQAANKNLTPVTLELGGKNAVYVDSTADLKIAATRIMWGKCFNSGQACISPDYLLCSKETEKEFIEHARKALEQFFGDNIQKSCPIINDYHFKRLARLLQDLKIGLGGETCALENFIEPTIAVDVNPDHPVMQEEIFGPILPVITVNSVQEAVEFINEREKALALYIFTNNSKSKEYFLENTSSGGVTVNDTLMHFMVENLPLSGVGSSGMGCYKGKHSFDTFVHKKSVLFKRFPKIVETFNPVRYPPYSKTKSKMIGILLHSRKGVLEGWKSFIFIFLVGFLLGGAALALLQ